MITKMLKRKIKNLNYDKIIVQMDVKSKENKGEAWVSSKDMFTLNQLIKLHYHIYASYKLTTFMQGYAYDSMEEMENQSKDKNYEIQKKMMKISLE